MSALLIILIVLIIAILVVLVIAASSSNEYTIERSIIINKPAQKVFDFVKYLKNADQYNKWVMADPNLRKNYTGEDGTVGFISAWDSDMKQVGKGAQEIINIDEGKRVDYEIRFEKPFKGTSFAHIITEPVSDNQTMVKWVFNGVRNLPMKIFHLLFSLQKALGKDLATSLSNLKALLEKEGN